jgi:hypothetical protein
VERILAAVEPDFGVWGNGAPDPASRKFAVR